MSFCILYFQQKTAYVMRISDWSSDVCSSDLSGSSAGGHLAAATALIPGFDYPSNPSDKAIDARPNALILYNPGLDTGSKAATDKIAALVGKEAAERGRELSPLDHLDQGLPPTLIFQGTADRTSTRLNSSH